MDQIDQSINQTQIKVIKNRNKYKQHEETTQRTDNSKKHYLDAGQ